MGAGERRRFLCLNIRIRHARVYLLCLGSRESIVLCSCTVVVSSGPAVERDSLSSRGWGSNSNPAAKGKRAEHSG